MNIFKTLGHYIYLAQWFARARFLGRRAPLQTVLFITDKCNLRCKHCSVYGSAGYKQRTFEDIVADMRYSYELGSRFIDLEGGEPTLWKEDGRTINDLIDAAMEIGFFSVTVTTNAGRGLGPGTSRTRSGKRHQTMSPGSGGDHMMGR